MKAKPIKCDVRMAEAIISGRKTCLRQAVLPHVESLSAFGSEYSGPTVSSLSNGMVCALKLPQGLTVRDMLEGNGFVPVITEQGLVNRSAKYHVAERRLARTFPAYYPGDILYVKEKWMPLGYSGDGLYHIHYADDTDIGYDIQPLTAVSSEGYFFPAEDMPESIARVRLRVTDVDIEPLRLISAQDLCAEGLDICRQCSEGKCVAKNAGECKFAVEAMQEFSRKWDELLRDETRHFVMRDSLFETYKWESNPYVWVYRFEKI